MDHRKKCVHTKTHLTLQEKHFDLWSLLAEITSWKYTGYLDREELWGALCRAAAPTKTAALL